MLGIIKDLFGMGRDSESIIRDIVEVRKKSRGTQNRILFEIEFNMTLLLDHYLVKGAEARKVIEKIRVRELARALDEGFDFRKIRKGTVEKDLVGDVPFLQHYIGMDCEAFLKRIRYHIEQIKLLPELYDIERTDRIDARRRLENLGKRYLLFAKFLKNR